jgi:tRNA(Ile)-lysidine synthase TilS/MesJ
MQAELFVLRLSRNSGVLGLAGTAFVSQLFAPNLKYDGDNFSRYGVILVRPMLEFSKDDMYKICQGSNHLWVEDPTNNSLLYVRNRIRASLRSLSIEGSQLHLSCCF